MGIEGRHILSTRAAESNDEFESVLISYGAVVECFPAIKITCIENNQALDRELSRVNDFDGIFFTSANGVKHFFERAKTLGVLYNNRIYAVGEKTGLMIKKYGYIPSFIPENFSSDSLIEELKSDEIKNKIFLFPKGNLSPDNIKNKLQDYSTVKEVIVYKTECPEYNKQHTDWIKNIIISGGLDCITFFSPSAVQNFYGILGKIDIKNTDIAVIGKTTMNKTLEYGVEVSIIPDKSTSENLAKAIVEYYEKMN